MIDIDIAVIGSGLAALKAISTAKTFNKSYIAIDSTYSVGGYIQSIGRLYRYLKSPLFIPQKAIDILEENSIQHNIKCYNTVKNILKEGPIDIKTAGYRSISIQRNWFKEWLEQKTLCYSNEVFKYIEQLLKASLKERFIASNIRKIDLDRNIVALSNGLIIKFKRLIYTWPLDILPRYIYGEKSKKVEEIVKNLNLDYTSIYILSYISIETETRDYIEFYIHGTKASRLHTAIKIPIDSYSITYIVTSYSSSYPLLPGIAEKLYSEAKKYGLINIPKTIEYNSTETIYALISNIDRNKFNELQQIASEYNIALYGRLGMWRESDIYSMLREDISTTLDNLF
jgi:hypothetical protein